MNHTLVGGQKLTNVHHGSSCIGRPCPIHNPSDHHMSEFPQNYRGDTGVMERLCPHGIGHPDPDHMVWANANGLEWHGVHGCDGCCRTDNDLEGP